MDYVDQIYHYKGRLDVQSRCGLKIVKKPDQHIVIATELYEENPGTTVTNFNTRLAALFVRDFGLDPKKLLFIEHCPDRGSTLEHYQEAFDIVRFNYIEGRFSDPDWERVSRQAVDEMIRD